MQEFCKVCVLGSSSAGNSTVIWNGSGALLVDAGFRPDYLLRGLARLDMDFNSVRGVFITHTHGDHFKMSTVSQFLKRGIPLYAPEPVLDSLRRTFKSLHKPEWQPLIRSIDESVEAAEFTVSAFEVPHDSEGGCFSYSLVTDVGGKRRRIVVSTDMGFPEEHTEPVFRDTDVFVIESNHDEELLRTSRRPYWLKERIRRVGHLSNTQSVQLMERILSASELQPAAIILAHLSVECNTPRHAQTEWNEMLHRNGNDGIKLIISSCNSATPVVTLT